MKKLLIALIVIALLVVAYYAASPYLTGQLLQGDDAIVVLEDGEEADPIALPLDAEAPEGFEGIEVEVDTDLPEWGDGEPVVTGEAVKVK